MSRDQIFAFSDCLKVFFLLSTPPIMIQTSEKKFQFCSKMLFSFEVSKFERGKLLKIIFFTQKKICKIVLTRNHYIRNFNAIDLLYIFLFELIEMLWSYIKCQKLKIGRGMNWVRINTFLFQKILDKIFWKRK